MTETCAGRDADRARRSARQARGNGRPRARRTSRSRSSIPRRARSCRAARRANSARAATTSCSATGTTRRPRASAIDAAGWMHSGDLATMDDDGYVRIVGRIKDIIIRGGENIYPREVEEFLHTSPASPRPRSSACRASAMARKSWPGSGCTNGAALSRTMTYGLLHGPDRELQDSALLEVRRRHSR